MNGIFAADSALMRFLTRVADAMILNGLFIVASLPVVTIGASLTALSFTGRRLATGACESVTGDFLRSFRRNLRQATALWLLMLLVGAALAAWFVVVNGVGVPPMLEFALLAIWYVVVFFCVAWAVYVFPYLATFEGTIPEVLRNARLLSLRHPLSTFLILTVLVLSAVVTIFSPQATGYGLLWLLIGFGGLAIVIGSVLDRVFSRYIDSSSER
ncbi:beta-carotene 15,15'-monooxygenase [Microbacterium barkeri]|uniref:Beta-carotene 15,15'-monooxygenase n=1 Tax=Microbacterium barkeri TaxID=33917 RepID=A0A9W6H256_9MICO|nr:YesL family protein [Microbacterium barkeri]MDR6877280.1 putative membrane protein YesL [Microbacterium barkeri]GLJ61187.1 beta-carotene 15,15'-monooxygenase [Microbacterium barkeri]